MAEKEFIDKVAFNYAIREAVKKYPNSFYNGLEAARQIAHDLSAADVRPVEWIPVTERLPEVRTWVLCYCRANSFDVFRMTDEGNWQYGNRSIYMKGYVTHWMPLPPAPKDGE